MKYAFALLAACCSLSVVTAQWLEETIPLPNSLPFTLVYSPQSDKVYCAHPGLWPPDCDSSLTVIDGAANQVAATVIVGYSPLALCWDSRDDKVYSANFVSNNVTVVDCSTDSVIATVAAGSRPTAICYNSQSNKVYCANNNGDDVTIINAATDQVIRSVAVTASPLALCYNPRDNKVYTSGEDDNEVTVIDGAMDSVVATVAVGYEPNSLCWIAQSSKVYCANAGSEDISVIDGATDSVIATVMAAAYAMCYDSVDNKVYAASGYDITVIDCAADSVVDIVPIGRNCEDICYDRLNGKVYCANTSCDTVTVIDCQTDSVLKTIEVGNEPVALAWNSVENRIYVANTSSSTVSVLRDSIYVSVEEACPPRVVNHKSAATVVRGVLFLPEATSLKPQAAGLLDISGRKVLNLRPGTNDVSRLAPGVYFVKSEPSAVIRKPSAVTKVVIQR